MLKTTIKTERPILFTEELVRAILAGRKTVTRRPYKGPSENYMIETRRQKYPAITELYKDVARSSGIHVSRCPYGFIGDKLYVRETFCIVENEQPAPYPLRSVFRATTPIQDRDKYTWKPSIHIPKDIARIWLEITDLRLEPIQDITEDEAKAEGVGKHLKTGSYRDLFRDAWSTLYSQEQWEENRLVWVIKFRKIAI